MSLRDEVRSVYEPISNRANPLRSKIQNEIDEFVSRGGKINQLSENEKGLADGDFLFMPECEGAKATMISARVMREKGKIGSTVMKLRAPKPASTGRRNIQKLSNGKFQVFLLRASHGAFDTLEEAVELRQQKRASLGYPIIGENE